MSIELGLILLLFAVIGYMGAGAALGVARSRDDGEPGTERDLGMLGVAALLFGFATLCSAVLGGMAAILAIGAVVTWASYLYTAQRVGAFQIECGSLSSFTAEEHRQAM